MNKVVLVGRLTADPELRYTASNKAYTRFTIAVNRNYKNEDGESEADFISVVAWEKRAEFMAAMIPSDVKSIMDIGCGDKKLKKYLTQDIKYYGLDFVSRGGDNCL